MKRSIGLLLASGLLLGTAGLTGCGKTENGDATNIVEMNASDGSMNDMTVVESATLDQAGAAASNVAGDNASNAM